MKKEVYEALETITEEINREYGFIEDTPCINYGPCGVFAYLFFHEWNSRFKEQVHICFIMTSDLEECYHICLRFHSKELYDGGIGIHHDAMYQNFIVQDMLEYDYKRLVRWSYGLDRTYPRYCPTFDKTRVQAIIERNLSKCDNPTLITT